MANKPANFNSTTTKKLILKNGTDWNTKQLRSVILKVLNANIKLEGPLRHTIRCTIVHSKKRWTGRGGYTGYAYYHSGTMKLRLPKPDGECWACNDGNQYRAIIDDQLVDPTPCSQCKGTREWPEGLLLDVYQFAHLFEHELMHCRGQKHETMGWLLRWSPEKKSHYPYLDGITVSPKIEKPKPVIDLKAARAARIDARILAWKRKRKRADTALKKLRKQQRYYQKAEAATMPVAAAPEAPSVEANHADGGNGRACGTAR